MINHPLYPNVRFRFHHVLTGCAVAVLFVLAAQRDVFGDYFHHANFAELLARGVENPPHFIYHLLVILTEKVSSLSYLQSGFVVSGCAILITFFLLFGYLQGEARSAYKAPIAFLCLALFFLHPIPLVFWADRHLYYGYMTANTFHNPTVVLLKPLALFHFILLSRFIEKPSLSVTRCLFLASLTALSILTKPSYMMTLLPSICLLWILSIPKGQQVSVKPNAKLIGLSLMIPTVLLIGWQFLQTFGDQGGEVTRWNQGKLAFAPLELFRYYSSLSSFIPKFLGSLAFPLTVGFFQFKTVKESFEFKLAFANMLVAALFNYCLVDKTGCFFCGDFGWSSQIALFLLNCVSLKIYFQSLDLKTDGFFDTWSKLQVAIPMAIFTLHFLSGGFWYASNLFPGKFTP